MPRVVATKTPMVLTWPSYSFLVTQHFVSHERWGHIDWFLVLIDLSQDTRMFMLYYQISSSYVLKIWTVVFNFISLRTCYDIFRVTGHLCGEFTGLRWIPRTKPMMRSVDVFFDLRLNKRLSRQSWGWWFERLSRPLWRQCNETMYVCMHAFTSVCVCLWLKSIG